MLTSCLLAVALSATPTASGPSGAARWLLEAALKSPLYKAVMVPQAKSTMVKTAESNGVPWRDALSWIQGQGPWELARDEASTAVPDYYRQPFHAYEEGNLCWEAAWEGEIASRAVGARNFPDYGADGEEAFRGAFDEALLSIGARCPAGGALVDFGCGSGVSTRRLATNFPQAASILGLDLSPHFLAVGRRLIELEPDGGGESNRPWVNAVKADRRVDLRRADIASTGLPDGCVDVVCLSLVIHELPPDATRRVCAEAYRILRPGGGQIWITEMDFDTARPPHLRPPPPPATHPPGPPCLPLHTLPCTHATPRASLHTCHATTICPCPSPAPLLRRRRASPSCEPTRSCSLLSARRSHTWTSMPITRRAAACRPIWSSAGLRTCASPPPPDAILRSWRRGPRTASRAVASTTDAPSSPSQTRT